MSTCDLGTGQQQVSLVTDGGTEIRNCAARQWLQLGAEFPDDSIRLSPCSAPSHCFHRSVVDLQKLCLMDALSAATEDARLTLHLTSFILIASHSVVNQSTSW